MSFNTNNKLETGRVVVYPLSIDDINQYRLMLKKKRKENINENSKTKKSVPIEPVLRNPNRISKKNISKKPISKKTISKKPISKKTISKKPHKSSYTFDMKRVIEERKADAEYYIKSAEIDERLKKVDALFEAENKEVPLVINLGYVLFDNMKYNLYSQFNSDFNTTLHSQELLELSIEEDEIIANTIFISLMRANWSPTLNEIKNIFHNWGGDFNTLVNNNFVIKSQINNEQKIAPHNFELIVNYITHCVLKQNNGFSNNDLLILAKCIFTISGDHYWGQITTPIKKLLGACIETALNIDDETAITVFAQELYLKYPLKDLVKLITGCFLPLQGPVIEKIYIYITYKSFKALLNVKINNPFPSSVKDWFIQDLVDSNYFIKRDNEILSNVLELLEHIISITKLNESSEFQNMFDFLSDVVDKQGIAFKFDSIHLMTLWKMQLFRMDVENFKKELEI